MAASLVEILNAYTPKNLDGEGFRRAAVLVPLQDRPDGEYLVLTQRAADLESHKGQIAFPGGRVDAKDRNELQTALRESFEEVGIEPRDVRVLGRLDQVTAGYNYLVTPFVGVIPYPYNFQLDTRETAAVFEVPVSALLRPGCFSAERRVSNPHRTDPIYHFRYENWDIWGATARIIKQLLELAYDFKAKESVV